MQKKGSNICSRPGLVFLVFRAAWMTALFCAVLPLLAERRDPDGRLSFENGSFDIPLVKGHNEIAVALYSSVRDNAGPRTAYAWGLQLKFNELKGITLQAPPPAPGTAS